MSSVPPWGVPWHGRIQNGQIALPNDALMAYPQPANGSNGALPGDTFLQRMPWAPGDERQSEAIADDAAAGRAWADYAILGGGRQALHGVPLDGWIYAAPDGRPWRVSPAQLAYDGGNAWSAELTASLFGQLGGPGISHAVTASLHDAGQSTPEIDAAPGWFAARVVDITPDGSRAIIAAIYRPTHLQWSRVYVYGQPVGFWLLTLSGTPGVDLAASVDVLRTRAQTIGHLTDTGIVEGVTESYPANGTFEETINYDPVSGISTRRISVSLEPTYQEYVRYAGTRTASTSRVVAMWFDPDGVPQPVTLSVHLSIECDSGLVEREAEGEIIYQTQGGQVISREGQIDFWRTRAYSATEQLTLTLTYNGSSVEEMITRTEQGSHEFHQLLTGGAPITTNTMETYDQLITRRGTVSTDLGNPYTNPSVVKNFSAAPQLWGIPEPGDTMALLSLFDSNTTVSLKGATVRLLGGTYSAGAGVVWYSNNLLALALAEHGADEVREVHAGSCLTPSGVEAGSSSTAAWVTYGSWNPVTGQIIRGESTPVCWT